MNRCRIGTYTVDPVMKVGLTTCKTELCSLDPGSARYDQWRFFWRLWAESWSDWPWYVRYQTVRLVRFLTSHFRGTGSSCIYPLLGCSQRPKWRLAATGNHTLSPDEISTIPVPTPNAEIDEKNFWYAKQNILQNNFQSRIHPLLTKPTDSLIPLDALNLEW